MATSNGCHLCLSPCSFSHAIAQKTEAFSRGYHVADVSKDKEDMKYGVYVGIFFFTIVVLSAYSLYLRSLK
jgi:hypothetical protein